MERLLAHFLIRGFMKYCTNYRKKALEGKITSEVQLLQLMAERNMYYSFYSTHKEKQLQFIERLVKGGIISSEAQQTLISSYKDYEIKTIPELLSYSRAFQLLDLSSYPADPAVIYPVIFEAIRKLLPDFRYSNLEISIIEKNESDLIRQDLRISFKVDSLTFTNTSFYDYRKQRPTKEDPDSPPAKLSEDFHKGVNKWLREMASPLRLYTVNLPEEGEGAYGHSKLGLLLLKEGQDVLIAEDPYLLSRESFDNRLSLENIDKLIRDFEGQGFFKHLSVQEINEARNKIAGVDINSIEEVLLQFPKTVVVFDWEAGNLENPYEELTQRFAEASRNTLKISGIVDEYAKGWKKAKQVKYGFTMNGKAYQKMLKFEEDWLDPEFMKLLKTAIKQSKVDGNIYYVIEDGQVAGYMFLTSKQHQFIKERYPDLLKE
jgi:hypothetical protein